MDPRRNAGLFLQSLEGEDGQQQQQQVVYLSPLSVTLAALLMLVNGVISFKLSLGLHTQIAIAAIRCIVQLSVLGYILVPIFNYGQWWLVLGYAFFMIWLASVEAISRLQHTYKGLFLNTLATVAACSSLAMAYALLLVLHLQPWWEPQYLIPMLGMVLGNTISGISVGLSTVLEELTSGRDKIEILLALGGTRFEATQALIQRAVRVAMTPLLNQMSVMGLVSIPGMMTGQILAGSDPAQAARYQMVIMFLLGATATLAPLVSIYLAVLHVVDSEHKLRSDRLMSRRSGSSLLAPLAKIAARIWLTCCCCCPCGKARNRQAKVGQRPEYDSEARGAADEMADGWIASRTNNAGLEQDSPAAPAAQEQLIVSVEVQHIAGDLRTPLLQQEQFDGNDAAQEQSQQQQQQQSTGTLRSWISWSLGYNDYRWYRHERT